MKNKVLSLTAAALALGAGTIAIAQHQGGRHGSDADADGSVTRAEMSPHAGTMFYARFRWVPFHPRVDRTDPAEFYRALGEFVSARGRQ